MTKVALIATLSVALNIWALLHPVPIISLFALFLFLMLICELLLVAPYIIVFMLPIIFFRITEFISFVAIEYGTYMTESMRFGVASGGSARYLMLNVLIILISAALIAPVWKKFQPIIARSTSFQDTSAGKTVVYATICTVLFLVSYLVIIGIQYGFPLIAGAERFAYRKSIPGWLFLTIIYQSIPIAFILGYLVAVSKYKILGTITYIIFLLCIVLFGEKQTSLSLNIIAFVMVPALVVIAKDGKLPVKSLVKLSAIIAIITVPVVLISYGFLSNPSEALTKFGQRVALQGQLWHLADNQAMHFGVRFNQDILNTEMSDWISPSFKPASQVGFEYGLYYVMAHFSEGDILNTYFQEKIGFIFSLYPAWLLQYGWVGLVLLSSLSAMVWSIISIIMMISMAKRAYIAVPILSLAFIMHVAAQIDGMSYRILGLQVLIILTIAYILVYVPVKFSKIPDHSSQLKVNGD